MGLNNIQIPIKKNRIGFCIRVANFVTDVQWRTFTYWLCRTTYQSKTVTIFIDAKSKDRHLFYELLFLKKYTCCVCCDSFETERNHIPFNKMRYE